MAGRDFGTVTVRHEGVELSAAAIVPGLTLHDLVVTYETAAAQAGPGDSLSGNPSLWPRTRGVRAVVEAVLAALERQSR